MDFMLGMAAQVRARETVDGYVETYMRRNPAARKTMEAVVMRLTERASDLRFDHLGFLAFAGLDDTAANSPRASPPAAGAGAVAVEEVEVAMEGMALEAPASQDPKQRVLSQVNLAELPGTAGAGAEEARQILAGAPRTVPPEPCP